MRLKSTLLWLGFGVLAAGLYLAAAYLHLHGELRGFKEDSRLQIFVAGSCPHSLPLVESPPEGSVVIPADWDNEAMTMKLCDDIMGESAFSAAPLRMRCNWLVTWAEEESDEAVGFPAYREGAGSFNLR